MAMSRIIFSSLQKSNYLTCVRNVASKAPSCPGKDQAPTGSSILNPKLETALNKQLNLELESSYKYMALEAFFKHQKVGMEGFARMQQRSSAEELRHAKCIVDLITMRGGSVRFTAVAAPETQEWQSVLEALQFALDIEENAYKTTNEVLALANEVKDFYVGDKVQKVLGEDTVKSLQILNRYICLLDSDQSSTLVHILNKELMSKKKLE